MEVKDYLTKDKDGVVCLWLSKPQRSVIGDYYVGYGERTIEDSSEFKDLEWGKIKQVTLRVKEDAKTD